MRADFVLLDENRQVMATLAGGEIIYERGGAEMQSKAGDQ